MLRGVSVIGDKVQCPGLRARECDHQSAITKITGVSRQTLYHFIGTRGLSPAR